MRAALRIVYGHLPVFGHVVPGIAVERRVAVGHDGTLPDRKVGMAARHLIGDPRMQPPLLRQMDDDHRVGRRGETRFPERLSGSLVRGRCRRGGQVEGTPVAFHGRLVRMADPKRPERLVALAVVALDLPLQAVGLRIVLPLEGGAHQRQRGSGFGADSGPDVDVVVAPVGFTGPERDVVEREYLLRRTAIKHRPEAAVPHGKGFLEIDRGPVEVQGQILVPPGRT